MKIRITMQFEVEDANGRPVTDGSLLEQLGRATAGEHVFGGIGVALDDGRPEPELEPESRVYRLPGWFKWYLGAVCLLVASWLYWSWCGDFGLF